MHSTASDGTVAPDQLPKLALDAGLVGFSLTDHDTLAGIAAATSEAAKCGIRFVPGIEVSCAFPRPGTVHLLGYGFNPESRPIRRLARLLEAARHRRTAEILDRLRHAGASLDMDEVRREAGTLGTIGRPHIAAVLIRRGYATSMRDAFTRYLGGGGVAYVDASPLSPEQVIELVNAGGGLVSLAHPLQTRRKNWDQLAALIRDLASAGMGGLETIHSTHDTDTVHRLTRLADRLGLLPTGGSDFHGSSKPWIRLGETAGGRRVPGEWMTDILRRTHRTKSPP